MVKTDSNKDGILFVGIGRIVHHL